MIIFDTPRRLVSRNPRLRRFKTTAHCSSTLTGPEGTAELLAFGRQIGLRASWLEHRGEPKEHFDLFDGAINRARRAGAQQVKAREWLFRCVYPKRATDWAPGVHRPLSVVRYQGFLWKCSSQATDETPGNGQGWRRIPDSDQQEQPWTL